ncbi:two-component system response regulator [Vitreoscilla filiformis]|jgi:DNA-binding response OmpR family regulator|uniref:Two-component system response regulator n=1 Tax=Vitreoscilla filiformis TaxID=63 RepID=A0A221KF66_VITFI|nr:response regulator transcription factor [Vitreoscilla filiformis]ASM77656.1 two-component system response regulator [Vitreoscilla filiformis]
MRILLVEDDPALSLGVARSLEREGWQVDVLADGEQALSEGLLNRFDLCILDWGLPRRDGLDVLRQWRTKGVRMPVLLLTARDELGDRVRGLDAGADDYLVKPFDVPELLARVRALKRRAEGRLEEVIRFGGLALDLAHRELTFNGERVPLSPRELALTEMLMHKAGRVVTKESIVVRLSTWEADFSENSVEVYVHRLRKRFSPLGVMIRTVRGFGYLMEIEAPAA